MLTRTNARLPLNLLIILTCFAFALSVTATVLIVIYKYLGFGIATNPVACTSTQTYFTTKYNHNNYLASIDVAMVIVLLAEVALLVVAIVLRVKAGGSNDAQQVFQSWTAKVQSWLFLLIGISSIFLIIPTGYFMSFAKELTSACSASFVTEWALIAAFCGVSLIFQLVSAAIVFRVRTDFEEEEQEGEKKQEVTEEKKRLVDEVSNQTNMGASGRKNMEDEGGAKEEEKGKENNREEGRFQQSPNDQKREHPANALRNQEANIRDPLLNSQEPSSRPLRKSQANEDLQREGQKLRQLRRSIEEEENRYHQLKDKKKDMEKERDYKKEEKGTNQTIINIHLTGGTAGSAPTAVVQEEKERKSKKEKTRKKYGTYRDPIYQESSEDSEESYKKRYRKGQDTHRFYSKKNYQAGSVNPHLQTNPNDPKQKEQFARHPSYQELPTINSNSKLKNLSLGVLPSVMVSPFASPQQPAQLLPSSSPLQESQVHKIGVFEEKNKKSLYKDLDQSKLKGNNVGLLQDPTPKKRKKQKNKSLEAYIQALNFNMSASRPDYQKNFYSNNNSEVSYNSVLSSIDKGQMPVERDFHERRDELRGVLPATVLSVAQKIQQRYKNR